MMQTLVVFDQCLGLRFDQLKGKIGIEIYKIWARALVEGFWEEAHVWEVVSLNPSAV